MKEVIKREVFKNVCEIFERLNNDKQVKNKSLAKLNELFETYPEILTIQNREGENLGMIACKMKLEKIVLAILNNHEASIQQDKNGNNIGIHAVYNNLEEAMLKALDNEEASTEQNNMGYNIGMCAASRGLKKVVEKALQNPAAKAQKTKTGLTIEIAQQLYEQEEKLEDYYKAYSYSCDLEDIENLLQ